MNNFDLCVNKIGEINHITSTCTFYVPFYFASISTTWKGFELQFRNGPPRQSNEFSNDKTIDVLQLSISYFMKTILYLVFSLRVNFLI